MSLDFVLLLQTIADSNNANWADADEILQNLKNNEPIVLINGLLSIIENNEVSEDLLVNAINFLTVPLPKNSTIVYSSYDLSSFPEELISRICDSLLSLFSASVKVADAASNVFTIFRLHSLNLSNSADLYNLIDLDHPETCTLALLKALKEMTFSLYVQEGSIEILRHLISFFTNIETSVEHHKYLLLIMSHFVSFIPYSSQNADVFGPLIHLGWEYTLESPKEGFQFWNSLLWRSFQVIELFPELPDHVYNALISDNEDARLGAARLVTVVQYEFIPNSQPIVRSLIDGRVYEIINSLLMNLSSDQSTDIVEEDSLTYVVSNALGVIIRQHKEVINDLFDYIQENYQSENPMNRFSSASTMRRLFFFNSPPDPDEELVINLFYHFLHDDSPRVVHEALQVLPCIIRFESFHADETLIESLYRIIQNNNDELSYYAMDTILMIIEKFDDEMRPQLINNLFNTVIDNNDQEKVSHIFRTFSALAPHLSPSACSEVLSPVFEIVEHYLTELPDSIANSSLIGLLSAITRRLNKDDVDPTTLFQLGVQLYDNGDTIDSFHLLDSILSVFQKDYSEILTYTISIITDNLNNNIEERELISLLQLTNTTIPLANNNEFLHQILHTALMISSASQVPDDVSIIITNIFLSLWDTKSELIDPHLSQIIENANFHHSDYSGLRLRFITHYLPVFTLEPHFLKAYRDAVSFVCFGSWNNSTSEHCIALLNAREHLDPEDLTRTNFAFLSSFFNKVSTNCDEKTAELIKSLLPEPSFKPVTIP